MAALGRGIYSVFKVSISMQHCQHPQNSSQSDLTTFLVGVLHCHLTCLLLSGISCFPLRSFLKQFIFLEQHSAVRAFDLHPHFVLPSCLGQLCSILMTDFVHYHSPILDGTNSLYHSVLCPGIDTDQRKFSTRFHNVWSRVFLSCFFLGAAASPPSPCELFGDVSKVTCKDWCEDVQFYDFSNNSVKNIAHCFLMIYRRCKEFLFRDFR